MINTSNIESIEDIENLEIPSPQETDNHHEDDLYHCDACNGWKRLKNMYSYDWCKNCYKHFLKCKFQKKPFIPWIWRNDLHDRYENKFGFKLKL
jgi:hypothetical protein